MAEAIAAVTPSKEMRITAGSDMDSGMVTSWNARAPTKVKIEHRRTTAKTRRRLDGGPGRWGRERTEEPHFRQYLAETGFACRRGQSLTPKLAPQLAQKGLASGENDWQLLQNFIQEAEGTEGRMRPTRTNGVRTVDEKATVRRW